MDSWWFPERSWGSLWRFPKDPGYFLGIPWILEGILWDFFGSFMDSWRFWRFSRDSWEILSIFYGSLGLFLESWRIFERFWWCSRDPEEIPCILLRFKGVLKRSQKDPGEPCGKLGVFLWDFSRSADRSLGLFRDFEPILAILQRSLGFFKDSLDLRWIFQGFLRLLRDSWEIPCIPQGFIGFLRDSDLRILCPLRSSLRVWIWQPILSGSFRIVCDPLAILFREQISVQLKVK